VIKIDHSRTQVLGHHLFAMKKFSRRRYSLGIVGPGAPFSNASHIATTDWIAAH
jgi:hypothetical protein